MGQEGDGQVALRAGAGTAPDRRVGGGHCAMTGFVFALFLRLEKFAARNGKTAERAFKAGAVGLGWVGWGGGKRNSPRRDQKFTSG